MMRAAAANASFNLASTSMTTSDHQSLGHGSQNNSIASNQVRADLTCGGAASETGIHSSSSTQDCLQQMNAAGMQHMFNQHQSLQQQQQQQPVRMSNDLQQQQSSE